MKIQRLILIFALVLTGICFAPAQAQDEPDCVPDLTTLTEFYDAAQTALTDGDLPAFLENLREMRIALSAIDVACSGLNFAGAKDTVSDPVEVPAGLYRITATTTEMLGMTSTPIDGKCGAGRAREDAYEVLTAYPGDAVDGTEVLFYSEGCTVIFSYEYVSEPFTIEWEKIK